jgi:hypothetical protein
VNGPSPAPGASAAAPIKTVPASAAPATTDPGRPGHDSRLPRRALAGEGTGEATRPSAGPRPWPRPPRP